MNKWKTIALPKALGCINIRQSIFINQAILVKLPQRLVENFDSLWAKIIEYIYFKDFDPLSCDFLNWACWFGWEYMIIYLLLRSFIVGK